MTEDDQVRRLLADARHDEPLPPDLADRLDGVLADLRGQPIDQPVEPAPVIDLAAARRRRRARALLAAAAAVVVVGVGVHWTRGLDGLVSTADSGADGGASSSAVGPESAAADGGSADSGDTPLQARHAVRLDPDRFDQQVARMRGRSAAYAAQDRSDALTAQAEPAGCPAPGRGDQVAVRYAGQPGVLVYRPARGDTQVVELYLCGETTPTRSVTLPTP